MSTDLLKISHETLEGDIVAISLGGPISVHTYEKLEAALDEILKAGHYNLIIDMKNVRYVSSEGLAHKGDSLHFSAAAARTLGRRYAEAYLALETTPPKR